MDLRFAILKAADSIQQFPKLFNFGSISCPDIGCGSPACALGWLGFYTKAKTYSRGHSYVNGLDSIVDVDSARFYRRMDALPGFRTWRTDAASCTKSLRLYADKYHPLTVEQECPYRETAAF